MADNQLEDALTPNDRVAQSFGSLPGVSDASITPNQLLNTIAPQQTADLPSLIQRVADRLFGANGQERYQLWPERMVREAIAAPHDVMTSTTPMTPDQMIPAAQAISGLVSGGGIAGTGERAGMALGSGPIFHSGVENALQSATQTKASLQQWLGYLKNTKGVSPQELDWLGIQNAPEFQSGQITKQQLQDYVTAHKVDLKDVTKGVSQVPQWENLSSDEQYKWLDAYQDANGVRPRGNDLKNFYEEQTRYSEPSEFQGGTRYQDYQLPGGTNYHEHLLTLPQKTSKAEIPGDIASEFQAAQNDKALNYQSSHWDEPNVLAHVRTNDRDVEGVPALHIEEIQSDWHQQGRKQGYQPEADAVKQQVQDLLKEASTLSPSDPRYKEIYQQLPALQTKASRQQVPDAPFKTSWPELALKRMIRQAADEGKTRVSWTPGADQRTNPKLLNPNAQDDQAVAAEKANQGLIGFYDTMLPKIAEKIGKPYGVKVQKGITNSSWRDYDIKFDPENEENVIVNGKPLNDEAALNPHIVAAMAMKQANGDVRKAATWLQNNYEDWQAPFQALSNTSKGQQVHYFDIPPKMRDTALEKGFPMFVGGLPVTPVQGNPFEGDDNAKRNAQRRR